MGHECLFVILKNDAAFIYPLGFMNLSNKIGVSINLHYVIW